MFHIEMSHKYNKKVSVTYNVNFQWLVAKGICYCNVQWVMRTPIESRQDMNTVSGYYGNYLKTYLSEEVNGFLLHF